MREVCYCDYGACGYCCAIGVIHTGAKPGCDAFVLLVVGAFLGSSYLVI